MNAPQAHSGHSATQNMIRHSLTPALLLDCNLLIIQTNEAMAALLARSVDDLVGQSFQSLFVDRLPENLLKLLDIQVLHSHPDQEIIVQIGSPTFSVRIVRILSEFGGPFGFLVQSDLATNLPNTVDWEAALQGAGQGVWDYDLSSGKKNYSETWYDMRGLNRADETSKNEDDWLDKIHPDDLVLTRKHSADLEAGLMQNVEYEYRERHEMGHWVWIMCRGRAIAWDENGHPTRYVGTDTDITTLKEFQNTVIKLNESDIRWKNAMESIQQGLWDHNEITGARYHSAQWYQIRGFEENTAGVDERDVWLSRLHPEDVERVIYEISLQNTPNGDSIELEYREWHQAGHWIWILSRGKVVQRNEAGQPVRVVGFDADITATKSSEDRMKRISKRLEMALAASHVGVWEFDLTTSHVEWDMVMRDMYGLPLDTSPLPRDVWERALHVDDLERVVSTTAKAVNSKSDYVLDYRIIRDDGLTRHIRSRASRIDDPIDGPKLLGLNWDMTKDYEFAQELKEAHAIALKNNIQLEAARKLMEHNALHDALTGLPNRRMLDQVQKASVENPTRLDKVFAVLHVDLDRFKQINDTLGHAAGDAALVHIAGILRDAVGKDDLVARVGGDEFAIFIEDSPSESKLIELAKRIIAKAAIPLKYMNHDCRCGVSIGIAFAKGRDVVENALFINADMAMYRSKFDGRGGFTVFNDEMKREALEKNSRSDQLLAALERDELFCVYQPQYDCRTLKLTGIETLVRWNNPVHGAMSPAEFLPLAEELQLIDRIDKAVLHLALRDLTAWRRQGFHVPRLSINISGRRLRDSHLARELRELSIPKNILSFEFLESIFLDEPDHVQNANIKCIRDLGIGIEVDDFGSGHSSIVSLLKLRPDRLKIDRSIVEPVIRSERQRHLVQSIVDIGKLQGIKVLAEGVETAQHVTILQAIGCDELQGYALSRPIPAAEMMQHLTRSVL